MAVAFRSASNTGNSTQVGSLAPSVPSGVQAGDIVVVSLCQWDNGSTPTVTPPSGFTQKGSTWTSGDSKAKNSVWWKRLTGADAGTYSFSWTGSFYSTIQVAAFSGCISSGDPWEAVATPVTGTFGTVTTMSVTVAAVGGALFWTVYNDSGGTHTPPTGFTETADVDCGTTAYSLIGSSGSNSAASGAVSSSSSAGAWLGALLAEPTGTNASAGSAAISVKVDQPTAAHAGSGGTVTDFTLIDHGAWVSAATGSDLFVPYPAAANGTTVPAQDRLYLILHSKPTTGSIAPSGSWTLAFSVTGGGGSFAADTGPTKFDVYYRDHPGTALTSTTTVTTTSVGTNGVASGKIVEFRPTVAGTPTWSHDLVSFSRTTAWQNSPSGFTSSAGMAVQDNDMVIFAVLSPDDGGTTDETVSTITQSGTTFNTPTQIGSKESTTLGFDLGSDIWQATATAGAGTGALSFTGSSTVSETRLFAWLRVRLNQGSGNTAVAPGFAAIGMAAQQPTVTAGVTTNASAGSAAASLAGQSATVKTSPSVGSAAVGMAAQNATVATSISRTPGVPAVGLAAQNPAPSISLVRTAGFATPSMSAEWPTVQIKTSAGSAAVAAAAQNASPSTATTAANAGNAAVGLASQGPTVKVAPVVGVATFALAAAPGSVFGGSTVSGGSASVAMTARAPAVSVKVSAGLAGFGFLAHDVINSDQSIACADFVTTVVVDAHFSAVGVEAHTTSMTVDAHEAIVVTDQHYASAEVCGRS